MNAVRILFVRSTPSETESNGYFHPAQMQGYARHIELCHTSAAHGVKNCHIFTAKRVNADRFDAFRSVSHGEKHIWRSWRSSKKMRFGALTLTWERKFDPFTPF